MDWLNFFNASIRNWFQRKNEKIKISHYWILDYENWCGRWTPLSIIFNLHQNQFFGGRNRSTHNYRHVLLYLFYFLTLYNINILSIYTIISTNEYTCHLIYPNHWTQLVSFFNYIIVSHFGNCLASIGDVHSQLLVFITWCLRVYIHVTYTF